MSPTVGLIIIAVLLIILGLIRFKRGHAVEGTAEIGVGVLEILVELIACLL
jgi:hypothetical protein